MMGIVCCIKRFTARSRNSHNDEEVGKEVQKWVRQQSKGVCAVGFDTLVKRWNSCINVGGGYIEK
jgi:hypothetical protein